MDCVTKKDSPALVHFEFSIVNQGFTVTSLRIDAQISSHHTQRRSDEGDSQDVRHPTAALSHDTEKDLHTARLSRTPAPNDPNEQKTHHQSSLKLSHAC